MKFVGKISEPARDGVGKGGTSLKSPTSPFSIEL